MANVNLVMVKNTKSNATRKNLFPAHLVVLKAEAEVRVPMIMVLIIKNATAPIITNGVIPKRNVFVRLLSNIHVQARDMPEEMEILVITNIQNVNVQTVLHGMLRKGHVFVPALISARSTSPVEM